MLDTEKNFFYLLKLCADNNLEQYSKLLTSLRNDMVSDGVTYLGFERAPAAKGVHHAFIGGLCQHYLEMYRWWEYQRNWLVNENITGDRILAGIILHDLHKAWATFIEDPASPSGLNYGKHPSDRLMTNNQKTMYLIQNQGIHLDMLQMNALWNSEGGWAEDSPKSCSSLAKALYLLDEWSGNVEARIRAGNAIDHQNVGLVDLVPYELKR